MGYSYKTYSETRDVMKKYVNAAEGAIIYSMSKTHLMTLVNEAGHYIRSVIQLLLTQRYLRFF